MNAATLSVDRKQWEMGRQGSEDATSHTTGQAFTGDPERADGSHAMSPLAALTAGGAREGPGGCPCLVTRFSIQAGGGHVARPISAAAGEEDQVAGEGLVLLDHDNVPNLPDRGTLTETRLRRAPSLAAGRCAQTPSGPVRREVRGR